MKPLGQICVVCALTLTLMSAAFAGQMDTGVTSTPSPPPAAQGQVEIGVAGDITTGVAGDIRTMSTEAAEESLFGAAISLLQGALSLF